MAILACSLAVACGGDDFETKGEDPAPPSPCNGEPWNCPAGQTCWPTGQGQTYECRNAGPATLGQTCQLYPDAPTCAAGLFCGINDVCTPFCSTSDPNRACPMGLVCLPLTVTGVDGQILTCTQQ